MARRRENARLARAAESSAERVADSTVGQFLIFGFGGAPRLLEFSPHGLFGMRVTDLRTGRSAPVRTTLVWKMAQLAQEAARG